MANTTVPTDLQVIKFRKDFYREYVRDNRLSSFAGKGETNVINMLQDRGPTIRHPLIVRLQGAGVSGSATLRGNGEAIGLYSWDTNPTYYRHSVEFDKERLEQTNIELMMAARPLLMEWAKSATRDRQLQALGAFYNGTTYTNYDGAAFTQAIADTWQVNNADRIIYGDNIALTGDHSAELGGIDSTNDIMTGVRVSDMRRLAEDADPHIRPISTDQEGEVYVLFLGSIAFRDLKANLQTLHSNADVRGMGNLTKGNNILARDGDMFWDGVIIRKVPEITTLYSKVGGPLYNTGASATTNVEPAFLVGSQAVSWGLGQAPDIIVDRDWDFKFQPGVAVELKEDVKKTYFNNVQHGMVSGFFSGAA